MKKGWLALFFSILFLGCSSKNINPPPEINSKKFLDVPYVPQQKYYCGPSSVLMILKYWQKKGYIKNTPTFDEIVKKVYIPQKKGSIKIELKSIIRDKNLLYFEKNQNLLYILKAIDNGFPVLVLLNLAFEKYPIWHYAVVFGYDIKKRKIYLRSRKQIETLSFYSFENLHKKANNWFLIITPSQKIPNFITKKEFINTLIELEKAKKYDLILKAAKNGLNRWRNDFEILTALGNSYYLLNRYKEAKKIYKKILTIKKDPLILNNLALTYMHLNECEKAKKSIKKAIELDQKNRDFYEKSYMEIINYCR